MSCSANSINMEDVCTSIIVTRATAEPIAIPLAMPSFTKQLVNHVLRKSLMIDTCVIKYSPQCPTNSIGTVRIVIYDDRLIGDDNRQAEFTFPVTFPVEITYYGSSYASVNEKSCPWRATYHLEDSNLKTNTYFSKIKGYLKFCSSLLPTEVNIRPPKIKVLSSTMSTDKVDVWHCKPSQPERALCHSGLYRVHSARFANVLHSGRGHSASELEMRKSISEYRPIKYNDEDPGPSASQVSGSSSGPNNISMGPDDMGQLINAVVSAVQNKPSTDNSNVFRPRIK